MSDAAEFVRAQLDADTRTGSLTGDQRAVMEGVLIATHRKPSDPESQR